MSIVRSTKGKKNSRQLKKRQRRMQLCAVILAALCISGLVLMPIFNEQAPDGSHTYTTREDVWYVPGPTVEIQAPAETPAPTQEPTPVPTEAPVATAVPQQEAYVAVAPPTPDPTREPTEILITAVGDCTFSSYKTREGKTSSFKRVAKEKGYDYFFENVREIFEQDDLTIINLEGPLTEYSKKRPRRTFNFRGLPEYVQIMTGSSVEICNMANNHALDYGTQGFEDTYNLLTENGIGASGYGPEYFTEVKGYTVGSLGFTEWNFEKKDILSAVEEAAGKCDLLIVSMHWGEEHKPKLSKSNRRLAQEMIDLGADLIIGNHPHIYGEIEIYNGKYIINTLGNFCFGGNDDPYIQDAAMFRQKFILSDDGSVEDGGIDIIPVYISSNKDFNDFQPKIAGAEDGARMLAEIQGFSPTLTDESVTWLEDSYVYTRGILEPKQPSGANENAMPIVQDTLL